jgi:hypothetical protein
MGIQLHEYITKSGEVILYTGKPDFSRLEVLASGFGDVWHSSLDQGFKNIFPELVYQTATFFWFVRDLIRKPLLSENRYGKHWADSMKPIKIPLCKP